MTFRLDPDLPMLAEFPCPVQVLPLRRTWDWQALHMGVRLARYIRREKVDIVQTFFASSDLWGGVIAKMSLRPAVISSRRDMGFLRTGKHKLAYRFLGGMYDRVLAVSEQVRLAMIEQDRLDPAKVITVYNSVEPPRSLTATELEQVRNRFGAGSASPVIISVGNLRSIKGFDVLIRAAAKVCREFPRAVFLVAGGPAPNEPDCLLGLQALSASLGISERVRFLGPVEDIAGLLQASDLFCLLSRTEGFSNSVIEAMICGLPCVVTRVGGNGEAVDHGESGFLVESGDDTAAAAAILRLLRDPAYAKAVGECARKSAVRRFSPATIISQLAGVYETVLSRRRRVSQ